MYLAIALQQDPQLVAGFSAFDVYTSQATISSVVSPQGAWGIAVKSANSPAEEAYAFFAVAQDAIVAFNVVTLKVSHINTISSPSCLAVSSDRATLYATYADSAVISMFSATSPFPELGQVSLPYSPIIPYGFAVVCPTQPNKGPQACVSMIHHDTPYTYVVDVAVVQNNVVSSTVRAGSTVGANYGTNPVAITPDGEHLLVTNLIESGHTIFGEYVTRYVAVIDTFSGTVTQVSAGTVAAPHGYGTWSIFADIVIDPSGSFAYLLDFYNEQSADQGYTSGVFLTRMGLSSAPYVLERVVDLAPILSGLNYPFQTSVPYRIEITPDGATIIILTAPGWNTPGHIIFYELATKKAQVAIVPNASGGFGRFVLEQPTELVTLQHLMPFK